MTAKRVILEMGSGNDLHGGDYTKAAVRAVEDAIHHSSLTFIRRSGSTRGRCRSRLRLASNGQKRSIAE